MGNPELNIGDSMLGENLVWMYDSNGCIVSTSHKLNKEEIFGVSFSAACRWIREWKCRD